ncbi:MAG TPA: sigma-54-dependent Fis family transcriptional regulator [Gammaproteobacteria bacterium]|nr:sigma-54-dependent Fis family transcriptional regulator [Gammaproteobacteria bacterium]
MAKLLHRLAELKMRRQAIQSPSGGPVLGVSSSMARLATQVGRLIEHPEIPVLLVGESGVGKEVVARYLHNLQCPQAPFEALNCAAVPNTLIGSELFGYEKGAFTGATQRHAGLFERAGRGIAFLDEIGDMPVEIQPVLLRLLQERRFLRLGGGQENEIQCRIVFATHQELRQLVETGAFREDLYYRINVVQIVIPPLRERREDIVWLARKFVADFSQEHPDSPRFLSEVVCDYLTSCHWPGNVRELKNAVLRACVLNNREVLEIEDFAYPQSETGGAGMALQAQRQQSEKDHILATLRSHGLRVAETAQALGISRKTLWQKMKKYDIRREKLS